MKIILIGFMGSGKSSLGRALGSRLKIPVIEMDEMIVKKTHGLDIPKIFSKYGETYFRELEISVAKDLKDINDCVISTGGGVVSNKIIIDYLKENNGQVIFLKTDFKDLEKRIGYDSNRPLFKDAQKAKRLFDFRQPLYQEYADIIIETDHKSIEEIATEVVGKLNNEN